MNKPDTRYPVYDLSPQKFENLCYDLIKEEYEFDSIELTYGPHDAGLDIFAKKGVYNIGIEIKHKYKIHRNDIEKIIHNFERFNKNFERFIFITSAFIRQETINEYQNSNTEIISRDELFNLLDKYPDITERHFTLLKSKKKNNDSWLKASSLIALFSITVIISQFLYNGEDPNLTNRINNVESTLYSLKNLENDLENIKGDMIEMEYENQRIKDEYEEVIGLEKALNNKKESLKVILDYEPWYKQIWKYLLGFILGIFSSIGGTILLEQWKIRRALTK